MSGNGDDAQDWAWCGVCKCWYPTPQEDSPHTHMPDKHPDKKKKK